MDNTLRLMSGEAPSGTEQIVALVQRTDSIVLKSEGTRVLAYCVKSLWRKDALPGAPAALDSRRKQAIVALTQVPVISALANLLVQGHRHTILLSESTFALTLISSKSESGRPIPSDSWGYTLIPRSSIRCLYCISCPGTIQTDNRRHTRCSN